MIYTYGDSHSVFGWAKIHGVICGHIGPVLMHSFDESSCNLSPSIKDSVVFCFGEIDVRGHIKKQIILGNTLENVASVLVNNYIDKILRLKFQNAYVYNIIPTRRVDTPEPYDISACTQYQKYNAEKAKPFPFTGSDIERREYNKLVNDLLKVKCAYNNIGFIDIFEKYCDCDGFLDMRLSDGTVHIDDEKFLKEWVENHLIPKI